MRYFIVTTVMILSAVLCFGYIKSEEPQYYYLEDLKKEFKKADISQMKILYAGIYESKNKSGEVEIEVKDGKIPTILVLAGYKVNKWIIKNESADIKYIIVSNWCKVTFDEKIKAKVVHISDYTIDSEYSLKPTYSLNSDSIHWEREGIKKVNKYMEEIFGRGADGYTGYNDIDKIELPEIELNEEKMRELNKIYEDIDKEAEKKFKVISNLFDYKEKEDDSKNRTWGYYLNKSNEIPLGKFKVFYINTLEPEKVLKSEITENICLNVSGIKELENSMEDIGAYWVGYMDFKEDEDYSIQFNLSGEEARITIDDKVITSRINKGKDIKYRFSKGRHKIEVEYINNWHTSYFMLAMKKYDKNYSEEEVKKIISKEKNAKIWLAELSGSRSKDNKIKIVVEKEKSPIILFLKTDNPVMWEIENKNKTNIKYIIVQTNRTGSIVSGDINSKSKIISSNETGYISRVFEERSSSFKEKYGRSITGYTKVFNGEKVYISEGTDANREVNVEEYYKNGKIKQRDKYTNGEKNGESIGYYENGKVSSKINFANGRMDGINISYYKNGNIKIKSSFKNGNIYGEYIKYYESGELRSRYFYNENKRNEVVDGEIIVYYKSGKIEKRINYYQGMPYGNMTLYYENGNIKGSIYFGKKGQEGEYIEYYENGQIALKVNYEEDEREGECNSYYKSGKLKYRCFYKNGVPDGEFISYYEDGTINQKHFYENRKQSGDSLVYYKNGNLFSKVNHKNGLIDGEVQNYYENGQIRNKLFYNEEKLNGIWTKYKSNGEIEWEKEYKDGEMVSSKGWEPKNYKNGDVKIIFGNITDSDEDGLLDYLDSDDDNDGILTKDENSDPNGDYNPDDAMCTTFEGIPDYLDGSYFLKIEKFMNEVVDK